MESHPLNLAHQQHRRADAHMINNRYDEAMQCHHNAAELLLDAMKSTNSTIALESITLQHSYHLKQKDFIKTKKEQYARVKRAIDNLKVVGKDPLLNVHVNENSKLQVAIYKAINETDSLLHLLLNKSEQDKIDKLHIETIHTSPDVVDGKKTEKTQQTVIEELQTLSQSLHSLVEQLVVQVEMLKDENMTLKERVTYLEKERVRYLNIPSTYGETSVNVFSPNMGSTEIATDVLTMPISNKNVTNYYLPSIELEEQARIATEKIKPKQQPHFDLSAFKND